MKPTDDLLIMFDSSTDAQAVSVNAETTATTISRKINIGEYFAVAFQASSGGIIDLKLELQQSHDNENWAISDVVETIIDDTEYKLKRLNTIPAQYFRFLVTGGPDNAATTKINIWVCIQRSE